MYSLGPLLSSIYPFLAMYSLLVTNISPKESFITLNKSVIGPKFGKKQYHPNMLECKAGPFLIPFKDNLKWGIGKLAYLKVDIGKILGKLPWISKIPLHGCHFKNSTGQSSCFRSKVDY